MREHRLPSGLSTALDRMWILLGRRHKTVTVGPLRFCVRRLAADEHFIRSVVIHEEYTPAGYEISAADLIVDVGGNIGSFALYAASKAPRGRVVSLEPIQDNYRLLVHNVAQNRLANILTQRAALVARRARVRVYLSTYGSGGHSVRPDLAQQDQDYEEVDGVTLEDVLQASQFPHCDFLKLDCEGAEFEIFREIRPAVCERVKRVVVEYHTFPDRDKREQSGQLVARLVELGFSIDHYTDVMGTNWGTIYARRLERDAAAKTER